MTGSYLDVVATGASGVVAMSSIIATQLYIVYGVKFKLQTKALAQRTAPAVPTSRHNRRSNRLCSVGIGSGDPRQR